jgi:hypothetical protein
MTERFSRRGVLTGMALTAANLLVSREIIAQVFQPWTTATC